MPLFPLSPRVLFALLFLSPSSSNAGERCLHLFRKTFWFPRIHLVTGGNGLKETRLQLGPLYCRNTKLRRKEKRKEKKRKLSRSVGSKWGRRCGETSRIDGLHGTTWNGGAAGAPVVSHLSVQVKLQKTTVDRRKKVSQHTRAKIMLASASATAIATVRKAPVIARAPIFCALFSQLSAFSPHACIQTFAA